MFLFQLHPFLQSLLGGIAIGVAAIVLMAGAGRIAGISNIVGGLLSREGLRESWRWWFLVGLTGGPLLLFFATSFMTLGLELPKTNMLVLILAGLLVGVGVTLGNGCTSGHGVCGLARLSPRSLVATLTFMATAIITVLVAKAF